ncbi:MAG: major vault protein, partial [Myxococcaceae bacterium]|nr:major vault protein [Myxococcaceae bacterium]
QTRILDFDEDLEVLELSTGTPKSDERVLETCFLQVEGNKVSDVVRMKTGDHVELEVALSYRVSFTTKNGEPERWFHVKNYVGLLCDHLASLVRSAARTTSIDAFHSTGVELLRTAILGEKEPDRPRLGRTFEENGMWVYDVEILDVRILDADVKKLLADAQKTAIVAEIQRRKEEMRLTSERLRESVDRAVLESQIATLAKQGEHEIERSKLAAARADAGIQLDKIDKLGKAKNDADAFEIASVARLVAKEKEAVLEERGRDARVRAFKEQMAALAPELVATLKTLGNQEMAVALSKNVSPLAILGGESVADVVARLVGSLPVGAHGERVREVLAGFTSSAVTKGGEAE